MMVMMIMLRLSATCYCQAASQKNESRPIRSQLLQANIKPQLHHTYQLFFNQSQHCQIVPPSCAQPRSRTYKSQGHAWSLESAPSSWRPPRCGTTCHCTFAPSVTPIHSSADSKLICSANSMTWPIPAILCRPSYSIVFYCIAFYCWTGQLRC